MIEAMRAEWGCTLKQAMFEESIAAAVALWPALLERHGAESNAMDPVTEARQKAKDRMRAHIAAHYVIRDH